MAIFDGARTLDTDRLAASGAVTMRRRKWHARRRFVIETIALAVGLAGVVAWILLLGSLT